MFVATIPDTAGGTLIVAKGNKDFVHIRNNSDTVTLYLKYDGSSTTLTTDVGFPVLPQGTFQIENNGPRNVYLQPIVGIAPTGTTVEVRVQGADAP